MTLLSDVKKWKIYSNSVAFSQYLNFNNNTSNNLSVLHMSIRVRCRVMKQNFKVVSKLAFEGTWFKLKVRFYV